MTIYRPGGIESDTGYSLPELNATLHRYCLSLTRSDWDSDDLMQDTWIKVLENMKDRTHMNPEALLLRIAKNTWIDRVRREGVYRRILEDRLDQILPKVSDARDENAIHLEVTFHLLFKHLSPLQRTVLLLRDVYEYNSAETAEILGTTEGAVKAALHRAHKVLRDLDPEEEMLLDTPENEEMAVNLQALAIAYQTGDVETAVRLIQWNSSEVSAIGVAPLQAQSSFANTLMPYSMSYQPQALMAA
ncbi:RNA polymerase subunit sigma-24 [Paenibacillus ihbetae]|uniref:RNA polymerase subunit sigma-24 n=1 Tax=Paenibacillus ihbetae TaxID=1870820 RepID=A0A1B2E5V0_9BACL|nr:RNA polymerase sigma factor [Paenibacillus ihbetae]ANY75346.1 RNA polymerase subunit sigma-24 [Paenibacillus ihbetae]